MAVVDASALVHALVSRPVAGALADRLGEAGVLDVPHLVDVEVLQALRGLVLRGQLTAEQATIARSHLDELTLRRFPHHPLRDRIWELRNNLTAYDAAYVALAEALGLPLITTDARLAGASGHRAEIELFAG